jgi:hypothetical protein
MDTRRRVDGGGSEQGFEAAMRLLAATMREAGECMLELQEALQMLRLANEPALAREVEWEAAKCLRKAMRRHS